MGKSEKQIEKEKARNQRIIDTAFQIFVEKKIEAVTMEEIARKAGIGRATLFRCYSSKPELVMAVCTAKWKAYFDKLDAIRPLESIHDIPAIDRFIFILICIRIIKIYSSITTTLTTIWYTRKVLLRRSMKNFINHYIR